MNKMLEAMNKGNSFYLNKKADMLGPSATQSDMDGMDQSSGANLPSAPKGPEESYGDDDQLHDLIVHAVKSALDGLNYNSDMEGRKEEMKNTITSAASSAVEQYFNEQLMSPHVSKTNNYPDEGGFSPTDIAWNEQ